MKRNEKIIIGLCALAVTITAALHFLEANAIATFSVAAIALALLAMIVGDGTEQLGSRLGPGATGILQASLASLPELFVAIFALRAGLAHVVQSALVGSILGNSLLVFGLAIFLGGMRNGNW
jgi:Ca2+:H+ antiporter